MLLVVVANIVAWALDHAVGGNQPGGKSGSSYATGGDGLAAYAQLLADYGYPVRRIRGDLAQADIDPGSTLIVTGGNGDAFLAAGDVDSVTALRGARRPGRARRPARARSPTRSPGSIRPSSTGSATTTTSPSRSAPLRTVRTDAAAAYAAGRDLTPLASEGDRVLLGGTQAASGGGGDDWTRWPTARPSRTPGSTKPTTPRSASRSRATAGTPVVFAEGVHGYGESRGLGAIPGRWKVALFGLGVAAIVFAWAHARRLGPPDRPTRDPAAGAVGLRRSDGEHARTHL